MGVELLLTSGLSSSKWTHGRPGALGRKYSGGAVKQHKCQTCGVTIAVGDLSPENLLTAITNHMWVVHTLPKVEEMLQESARS